MNEFIEKELTLLANNLALFAKKLEGKTLLITGGAGFLGSYFIGSLQQLNKNHFTKPVHIIALDNFITGTKNNPFYDVNDKNLDFIKYDISNPYQTDKDIHFIIHAAGIASPVYYAKYPLETIRAAVDGLVNTIKIAREKNVEGILSFSSSEIYGDPHEGVIPTREDYSGNVSSTGLRACYDESKRLGETIATVHHRMHGVPITIIRPFNVYGPGMKREDYRVLPNFLNAALDNAPIELHGNGEQTRTFCYATDAIEGFLRVLLLGRPGEAYNIGSDDDEISMYDLAKKVESVHGKPLSITKVGYPDGYPVGDPKRRRPDITKARTELGFNPMTSLEDGLAKTLQWYHFLRQ